MKRAHEVRRWRSLASVATAVAGLLAACDDPSRVVNPEERAATLAASADRTPRPQMSLESILADMGDLEKTDGTLLVGLKEAGTARGVSVQGVELPLEARHAAERAVRQGVPNLELVHGVSRAVNFRSIDGVAVDVIHRTYINVRVPRSRAALQALRNHPNVDYITPNYIIADERTTASGEEQVAAALAMAATEYRAWGIDTVRAPRVWNTGIVGENIRYYMIDSGFDPWVGYSAYHPDFEFSIGFNNYAQNRAGETCTSSSQRCYWEGPLHGSGVMGMAVGERNGKGAVGVAPRTNTGVTILKPYSSATGMPVQDYADAIRAVGLMNNTGETQVAQTSLGYNSTNAAAYQAVADALSYTVNQRNTIFIAAAANNNGGPATIPELFPEVVGVGSLYQNLTRYSSPIDPRMELVAPGYQMRMSWNRDADDASPYTGTKVSSGTSFAAPIVAGVALLTLQANPGLTAADLRTTLRNAARDLGPAGKDNEFGYGMVDAVCAVQRLTSCRPLSAFVSGPSYISTSGNYTWEAMPTGGSGSYTYRWEASWDGGWYWYDVGDGKQYSTWVMEGDGSFDLRVTVTAGESVTAYKHVNVAGGTCMQAAIPC